MENRDKIQKMRDNINERFSQFDNLFVPVEKTYQNVMLIDDSEMCNDFHYVLLNSIDMFGKVTLYTDPEKALEEIKRSNKPDIIFINILLSEYNKRDFISELRQLSDSKIIYISMTLENGQLIKTKDFNYIPKPLSINKIYKILDKIA